jgi:hypothetical protein
MSGVPGLGGGGKSSGTDYNAAAATSAAQKQIARNAVNAAFGVAPSQDSITPGALGVKSGGHGFNPLSGQVTGGWIGTGSTIFNPAGGMFGSSHTVGGHTNYDAYNSAIDEYNQEVADAAKNKSARDSLYGQVRTDAFNAGKTGLDDTKSTAARQNKFALFAQGLNGGSADIDESALLDRTYNQGLLDLGAKADAAKADLQSNDEKTRLGLLQSVDNGMSTSDALTSALNQMKSGADSAEADAKGTSLGDLFANAGLLYTKSNAARGSQAAYSNFPNLFPSAAASLSGGKNGGIVTSTGP